MIYRDFRIKIFIGIVLLAGAFVNFSISVFADSSSYYDKDAASVFPIENKSIVMKKEILKIEPDFEAADYKNPDSPISAIRDIYCSKKYEGNAKQYMQDDLKNSDLEKIMTPYVKELKSKAQILYVKALRNEIYARHGREFKSIELLDIFGNCDWYKPSKNYSDAMLNEFERKNIESISDYEKRKGWN